MLWEACKKVHETWILLQSTQAMKYLTQIQQERPWCLNFSFFSPKCWNELGGKKRGSLVWPGLRSFSAFRGAHKLASWAPKCECLTQLSFRWRWTCIIILLTLEGHYSTMSRPQVFLKQSHKVAAGCSGESLLEETVSGGLCRVIVQSTRESK